MSRTDEITTRRHASQATDPPFVRGYPIVGLLPSMVLDPKEFSAKILREHGDIVRVKLGWSEVYLICHPDHVRYVLQDKYRNFGKSGSFWEAARSVIGNGLATSEGDMWLRQRRMLQPSFHRQRLAELTGSIIEAIVDVLTPLERAAGNGNTIDLAAEMQAITMRIIMRAMFGASVRPAELAEVALCMKHSIRFMSIYCLLSAFPKWLPMWGKHDFEKALKTIDAFIFRLIAERRAQGGDTVDLLSMLVHAHDVETDSAMNDQELRDEVITVFFAGVENTANTLAWLFYTLTQYPEIERKIREEVDRVLDGAIPTFGDLEKLTYCKMVLHETLRFYSPVWASSRTALTDEEVGGYRIRAGATLLIVMYAAHHHPAFWENPEQFNPERFNVKQSSDLSKLANFTFFTGPHKCIGEHLAIMEMLLVLAMVVQRYQVRLIPGHKVKPRTVFVTSAPDGGVPVKLERAQGVSKN